MTDPRLWLAAGAIVGCLLGGMFQHHLPLGWLLGSLGGITGFGAFALTCRFCSKWIGEPCGWAVGGPIGFAVGGAILMMALGDDPSPTAMMGAMGGSIMGAICGPMCGMAAWSRNKSGYGALWVIAPIFLVGVAAIALIMVLRSD